MRRAYLAVSIDHRPHLESVIQTLQNCLKKYSINLFVFVDHYHFSSKEEEKMMQTAMMEIDRSDILIAEVSVKAIGVGLEAGYAAAKNKPVWYLRNRASSHSSTVSGIASERIFYRDEQDLSDQLAGFIPKYH
ncbi:MAG: nucleoside 2-deoxyribosyltransferase [Chitinophagaceae bacterium]|nr:nucleoside 2-deoxyribosyltransferase [Chitinophagaceae bacterium]